MSDKEQIQQIEQEAEKEFPYIQFGRMYENMFPENVQDSNSRIDSKRLAYKAGRLKSDEEKDKEIFRLRGLLRDCIIEEKWEEYNIQPNN